MFSSKFKLINQNESLIEFNGKELKKERSREALTLLCWNVFKERKGKQFYDEYRRIVNDVDLVCLQEVHLSSEANDFFESFHFTYLLSASFLYASDLSPSGSLIGSAINPLNKCTSLLSKGVEPIIGTPKSCAIAEIEIGPSCVLLLASIHGINRASNSLFEQQIDEIINHLSSHRGPMILAGDFNTQSAKKYDYLMKKIDSLGMTPVSFPLDGRTKSKLSRRPLDHIFTRECKVIESNCVESNASDHTPMKIRIKIE